MENLETLLAGLRAAGEHTRLRMLALCARGELSVSELTKILGQSQPRVSRHLKLMVDAGLLERMPEGAQVYFRIADHASSAQLAQSLVSLIPDSDASLRRDLSQLQQVRDARTQKAQDYFQQVEKSWEAIRSMHAPEHLLEDALLDVVGSEPIGDLLDIGTGTGRMLEILADRVSRGVGVDLSRGMLAVARTNIDRSGLTHLHARQGDMYHLPVDDDSIDLAILHLVLHYSDDPAEVIREASRVLRADGRLIVVDFATHNEEYLRSEFEHRQLGFCDEEIQQYLFDAGISAIQDSRQLAGDPLTINIWMARKKESSIISDSPGKIAEQGRN
jgi:ubiquinone/menaquinone biosynthesis C-methylase UbiE/DNA-binding transcriptional ArsR family regulator